MFQLPVSVYESVIDLINGEATMLFVELQYTLATEEAERIGVDHVARMSTSETGSSSTGQSFNVKMIMLSSMLGYFLNTIEKM